MSLRPICALIPTLLVALSYSENASAQPSSFDEAEVRATCEDEWQADYSMKAYCIRQHREGHGDYTERYAEESDDEMLIAFQRCEREWLPQWSMVAYCAEQQLSGRRQLEGLPQSIPADVAETIASKCRSEWANDFAMMAYCGDRQASAWQELNQ